jgi:hypothetical protein
MPNILLIDGNASWVRSLFAAMKNQTRVRALRIHSGWKVINIQSWQPQPDGIIDRSFTVPGWTRFPALSTALLRGAIRNSIDRLSIDLVVYTLPFYAEVAEKFSGRIRQIYYAFDPYRFYDWNPDRTAILERKMVRSCDATFAVSQALVEDLCKISDRPVIYSPNATSNGYVEALAGTGPVAEELSALPRPIIGCVGQINQSYDWPLIGSLADQFPDATFVFVGPVFPEPPELQQRMHAVWARKNVKWLGPRPHARLPEFLRGFDVCFNPLTISEQSDRRSVLRLYDYLATDRPILGTAIREALSHNGLIHTFNNAQEGGAILREAIAGRLPVDMPARSRYIRQNTWDARAMQFLEHLNSLPDIRGAR